MTKTLKQILGATIIVTSLSIIPYYPVSAQMTGSTTQNENKYKQGIEKIKRYTDRQKEATIKVIRKFIPYGFILNPAIDGATWAAKQQGKRGYPAGTGSTIRKNR